MTPALPAATAEPRAHRRLTSFIVIAFALGGVTLAFATYAVAVSVTIPYSATPVSDADLDGDPATGAWSDALSVTVPLETGVAAPYGTATLVAKHDGTFLYFRIDGSIDVPWTSAAGDHFWLAMQVSPTGTVHHAGGTWDGVLIGLWDGTDYTPQPSYPPLAVDTNSFTRPPSKDTSQDVTGRMRYSGSAAPYGFTAEWKRKLNTGDAQDIAYAADGATTYNFFVTMDSNGGGSSGGNVGHRGMDNVNTMKFAPAAGPNTPPSVDLTTPDGGEVWTGGTAHAIRWNMSDAETATSSLRVWINVSTDGGAGYSPIAGVQGASGFSNPCAYTWTVPSVATSQGRVRVTVVDAAGASAADASLADFTIDATAPTVAAFVPADGSTGVALSTAVVVGFSEAMQPSSAEQAFSLRRLDTGAYAPGAFSWSGNDLTFTPSAALAGGVVYRAQVNASAKDASDPGNPMASSASASFTTADIIPPTISGETAVPSPQEAGGVVNVTAAVSDNGALVGVWIEVLAPGGSSLGNISAGYDPGSARYYRAGPYSLPGTYDFRIAAQDAAGNWAVATGTFDIVDTTPPSILHVPVAEGLVSVPIGLAATASDADRVADVRVDYTDVLGARFNASATLVGSVYEFEIPAQPQVGTLSYFVWAIDPSGNANRTPTYPVTISATDAAPPSISAVVATPAIQEAGLTVNVSAQVSDNVALASVAILVTDPNDVPLGNFTMVRLGASDTFYFESAYAALGTHRFAIWALDTSANAASAEGTFEIVDTLAPAIVSFQVAPSVLEAGQSVNVSATVTDNVAVASARIVIRDAGGTVLVNATPSRSGDRFWLETTLRSLGNLSAEMFATDPSGNEAVAAGSVAVQDTQPPVADPGTDVEVWVGTTVALNASGSWDNSAIANVSWSFTYNGGAVVLYGEEVRFLFEATGEFAVTLRVIDLAGLEGTAVITVRIVTDTSAPPAPGEATATPSSTGCLVVTWTASVAGDLAGYRLSRWNETAYRFDLLAILPADTTSYEDCGLAEGAAQTYWVVAFDGYGNDSPPSPLAIGRLPAEDVPPEGLTGLYPVLLAMALIFVVAAVALWAGSRKRNAGPPAG